jgi:hypothetical protein
MTTAFDAPLNEAFRDAMLALYLHEAVPNDPYLIEQGLTQHIKTANDLYEFWLLDVLVSQDVPTSPVACAIASYQQQINSMMLNMEPGYSDVSFTPQQIKTWRDGLNRYPIWSAIQQLHYFPDIYLDPTLRLTKTDSFEQLENNLNQAQIKPETVQTAVLSYLAKFEEIANLKICNGYIDGEDFANSTYYFIGKSPAENAYYWRSLDMSQRPVKAPAAAPDIIPDKFDKPLPNAWSDWQRANVPISEKALEHTIRPCWFNNRLFVVWAELELQDADAMQSPEEGRAEAGVKVNPRFRLYASYKKYDDSWSTPRIYIEHYCQTKALIEKPLEQIAKETQTIAVYDHSTSPESMVIMLYSNYEARTSEIPGNSDKYDFLRTVRIDKNFNVTPLFPSHGVVPNDKPGTPPSATAFQDGSGHVLLIGHIFANRNAGRFQYWLPASTPVFGALEHETPETEENTWNFNNWQSRIKTWEERSELVYHPGSSSIELILRLDEGFADVTTIKFSVSTSTGVELFNLTLVFSHTDKSEWLTLLEGSEIKSFTGFMDNPDTVYCFRGFPDRIRSLISDPDSNNRTEFSVPRLAPSETASLKGKLAGSHILDLLRDHPDQIAILDFWRFPRGGESSSMIVLSGIKDHVVESYGYQLFIGHPLDVTATEFPTTLEDIRPLYRSGIVEKLPEYSGGGAITVPVDKISYQPVGWPVEWPDNPAEMKIPLVYGVLIHNKNRFGYSLVGGALKAISITWGEALATEQQIAPRINDHDSPSLGNAQYIDFAGSSIEFNDGYKPKGGSRAPIRMNTTFARQLIQLAESGIDPLLSWETQTQQTEPPIPNGLGAQAMDFSGAYYLYFLELFLYLPWLVAYRLNEEQQYEEANHWLAYLFDPSRQSADPGHPGYWQSVPLETPVWPDAPDPSQAILYPDDPHQIALSFPVHFRKALYGLYIDIESNQADQAYRELTPDGLAEAKLRYIHILELLGSRPDVRQFDDHIARKLDELAAAKNDDLRAFEQLLIDTQHQRQEQPPLRIGKAPASQDAPLLCPRPYGDGLSLSTVDNPYLRRPFNPELIKRWDRAESRLYNLRHNLDMAGNPLNLPLFAAPLDPRALLAAWGQGLSGAALSRLLSPQIPHYRFSFMFALAQNAVDSVIQFGSTLLSLIERKEQAQYLELQQQQAWNLAKMAVDIQTQAMEIDKKSLAALTASQATILHRVNYYSELLDNGLSTDEESISESFNRAALFDETGHIIAGVGHLARTPPSIFGLASGGWDFSGPFLATSSGLSAASTIRRNWASIAEMRSRYDRRDQEWTQALDQSKLEAEQIKAQLAVQEAQHHATQLQLRQAQTALNQAKATHDFLLSSNRFSRSQTYDWLNSKFAGFYHTAYTTAQSLCQAAEACWQYEMGDFTRTFIRPGAWNASYRGLGAGEELKMSLQQMHSQYLQNNRRDLEIRKTVSLKDLSDQYPGPSLNKPWAEIKKSLVENGTCEFELTQAMFDDDYAGENHYLRRIKTISVTLPACLGPYQDIRAILRQTYSKVEMAATAGNVKENLRASQQIALSTSLEDNGMFQLNFQDDRYLPFEYTGAVSRWSLIFPNHEAQQSLLQSLNDVIVHVSYMARCEGGSL